MSDVQNIITLGIGSAPGDIHFFLLLGLDVNPVAPSVIGDVSIADASRYQASVLDASRYHVTISDDTV